MVRERKEELLIRISELENRLAESEQFIEAIQSGEVDAFAINKNNIPEVYTLQSGDYAYRVLIEEFGEGAINVTEEGLIVYTNTCFCDLIKSPYENVVGSSIFDFIDKNSLETFNELFADSLIGKSKGEIYLFANGQKIPVYISFTSLQPKLASVGIIVSDLSEKKRNEKIILQYQKDLESKNIELTQSNAELASFAFVASHDLQEPLRKIHSFSNLILEKEKGVFSEKTKDYFQRILSAASRMSKLIEELLHYSRINTSDIVFTRTELNSIVNEVRDDLREVLEENNATIESGNLPVLKIIPHQFIQLFSNLILNAIKFKKSGVNPIINIHAEIVSANETPLAGLSYENNYWKIQIQDNGIGFEQVYETKIFELFQRLHGRSEYDGTGIGLAICKKIVQNHSGFIRATGEPGVGAAFIIYLPVDQNEISE